MIFHNSTIIKNLTAVAFAAVAGGIYVLAFAPFYWWPLSMLSIAILFTVWTIVTPRMAALTGFVFGLSMYGAGVSWMYISLNTYGDMPAQAAVFSILLGIVFMSVYPMICGLLQSLFASRSVTSRLCVFMPAIWILIEWVRGWLFTGFPWLSMGYAYLDTPLSNYAPIGGIYLVGYMALLSVGAVVAVLRNISVWNGTFAAIIAVAWIGGWLLNETAWTTEEGKPIQVSVVQNNVALNDKWDKKLISKIIAEYLQVSESLRDSDLIVWPEAAVPDFLDNLSNEFWLQVEAHPADFIFGVLHRDDSSGEMLYYNSVVAVTDQIMIYRKRHLVPFGEYFPLQWLFGPLMDMLNIPMSEFSPWISAQLPLVAADNEFAVSICFEDAFPQEGRYQVGRSGIMLNVSEDIWFGDSLAIYQRLQMARFRARESERPMIRSSNTGFSSLINWRGGIEEYAPQFEKRIVSGVVAPRTGVTPYVAFGDSPALSLAGLMLLLGLIFTRRKFTVTKRSGLS